MKLPPYHVAVIIAGALWLALWVAVAALIVYGIAYVGFAS